MPSALRQHSFQLPPLPGLSTTKMSQEVASFSKDAIVMTTRILRRYRHDHPRQVLPQSLDLSQRDLGEPV